MTRRSFLDGAGPVITAIMSGPDPADLVALAEMARARGAQGIAINLADLEPRHHHAAALRQVFEAVDLPCMGFFYRSDRYPDDEARQRVLLAAAGAGAAMIDVMGDLFDPSEREITADLVAIDRQRRLIDQIHGLGAEVVLSSHQDCPASTDQAIEHLAALERRGADVVKLVATADNEDELVEAIATSMALRRALSGPYIHLCTGSYARLHRYLGPKLGSAIVFATVQPGAYGYHQPTVESLVATLAHIDWDIDGVNASLGPSLA